jgi:hypothetical protein
MAVKKSAAKPAKSNPNVLQVKDGKNGISKDMTKSQILAALTSRSYLTAPALKAYSGYSKELEVSDMVDEMRKAGDEVVSGDLDRVERMLMNQAMILDTIFANLAERSTRQEYMKQMETYLRLALKAQAQGRATAETLAMLKNPQPYIKQANIAQGHQQVNNTYASASAHSNDASIIDPSYQNPAEISQSKPNKLLKEEHGNTLDTRTKTAAGRANQAVEAVG